MRWGSDGKQIKVVKDDDGRTDQSVTNAACRIVDKSMYSLLMNKINERLRLDMEVRLPPGKLFYAYAYVMLYSVYSDWH